MNCVFNINVPSNYNTIYRYNNTVSQTLIRILMESLYLYTRNNDILRLNRDPADQYQHIDTLA